MIWLVLLMEAVAATIVFLNTVSATASKALALAILDTPNVSSAVTNAKGPAVGDGVGRGVGFGIGI